MRLWKQIWRLMQMTRRVGGWRQASRLLQDAPKYALLLKRLLADARVPIFAKVILLGAAVFAVSPLNLPQYLPVIGALDDLGIALFAWNLFIKQVPHEVLAEHRQTVGLDPFFERA